MPIPRELVSCQVEDLPNMAGVLVVTCPKGKGEYQILENLDCEDIRQTVSANAHQWALRCHGYLAYLVFVSDDQDARQRVLLGVESFRKTGK